ncbi:MAG: ParB/RepB/Spo0J family partition protein [Thermoproteota archaeon]|nr:ParB/RepB/Spo0J family partition protein [Thermoproteota archaeon]
MSALQSSVWDYKQEDKNSSRHNFPFFQVFCWYIMINPDLYVDESLPVDSIKSPRILVRESETSSARDNTVRELAASMRQHGLLHPIIVRPIDEGFEIVAGNRRFEACKLLRWKYVPAKVRELSEKGAFELQLIENIQRMTFNPIDEARAF